MFFSRQVQFVHPQHDVLVAFKILHLLIQAQAQVGPVGGIFLADQQLAHFVNITVMELAVERHPEEQPQNDGNE